MREVLICVSRLKSDISGMERSSEVCGWYKARHFSPSLPNIKKRGQFLSLVPVLLFSRPIPIVLLFETVSEFHFILLSPSSTAGEAGGA